VTGTQGPARYELTFGRDAQGRAVARGHVVMSPTLTCQRCLAEVTVAIDAPISLALVRRVSDADALGLTAIVGVPEDLDPLPLGEEPIRPTDLVEDELLLALPQVPMHPAGECCVVQPEAAAVAGAEDRENPFAVLAALRGAGPKPGSDGR